MGELSGERPGGTTGKRGACVRGGARICGEQRSKCGRGSAAETRVRGARWAQGAREGAREPRHGQEGGVGSGARRRPGGAGRSRAQGLGGRRPRAARAAQGLRRRGTHQDGFREVTARVSSPTRPTHLSSPLAAARQAAPVLRHTVPPPPDAALLGRPPFVCPSLHHSPSSAQEVTSRPGAPAAARALPCL